MRQLGLAVVLCVMAVLPANAQESPMEEPTSESAMETVIDTVRVTGTWAPLAHERLPENMTIIEGAELRRRGAADLRTAMALVTGVEAVPGGDAGPAGAVPAFWGLREFDAFLLVVDGVPWGGAFIPNLPTLDLNDVDRIEVLRGPAPITYGATSFVGVIHVLHKNPGSGLRHVEVGGGSYGSFHGSAATDIGTISRLSVDGSTNRYADESTSFDRVHGRYRLSLAHGIQVDADAHVVNQDPASPSPRKGTSLDPAIPIDSNHNPDDAKLNTTRLQLSATQSARIVSWTVAASHVEDDFIRGFLQPDATDDGSTPNANGYTQERDLTEFYGLAHHRFTPMEKIGLTIGGDALFGKGKEESENFQYYAALDGTRRENSSQGVPVEDTDFEAERTFLGAFTEADWHPTRAWTVLAGVRLNDVEEKREGETEVGGVPTPATVKDSHTRLGGRLGVAWQAVQSSSRDLTLYANACDTFKPAAIDFGPEAEVEPLDPETARSIEVGFRTGLLQKRLHLDASIFRMDFENLVVSTIVNGNPALENAGKERFDGVELDTEFSINKQWRALATYAWHEATFTDYEQDFGGVVTSLDGKRLEMSPKHLASGGLAYNGGMFYGEVLANYIGERFLNKRNTALAEAYTTLDASAGVRLRGIDVKLTGRNLTDRRDPVAESELGDAQYYRMPAASVELSTTIGL